MASRPLMVAAVAGALLLVVVGVDASVNRTFALSLRHEGEDVVVARSFSEDGPYPARPVPAQYFIDPNSTLLFTLRVDNEYPWAFEEPYHVQVNGRPVADGTLRAGALQSGEATFEVPAGEAFEQPGADGRQPPSSSFVNVWVQVGDQSLYADFSIARPEAPE